MQRSSFFRIAGIAALATGMAVVAIRYPVQQYSRGFVGWVRGLGALGPVIVAATYIPACVLWVPGSILTLAAGFLFGVVRGTIAVSVGSTLGAATAFVVGRTLARGWVERLTGGNPKFRALDEAVAKEGFKIVLLTRLSPVFPFNGLNYAYGLTSVRFRDYFLASWIGMLPGTVMYVYLGSAVKSVSDLAAESESSSGPRRVFFFVGLGVAIAVTVLVTRIARKALARALPQGAIHD